MNKMKGYFEHFKMVLSAHWKKIILFWLMSVILFISILYILIRTEALGDLPGKEQLRDIKNPTSSLLYSKDSVLINRYFIQDRTDIRHSDLPNHLIHALLSTEDIRFYSHAGVDTRSLFRVLFKTILLRREASGGGSTLTQQIVKNTFPRRRYRLFSAVINKWREMIIARRLEKHYAKDELMALYLNTVSFGERAFGIETAAQRFFSVSVIGLSIESSATLIGMLKAPSYYSPRRYADRALGRRNVVFAQMKKYGYIDDAAKDSLSQLPLNLKYKSPSDLSNQSAYIKQFVKKEFDLWNNSLDEPHHIYHDGLRIYSTVDLSLQSHAEKSIKSHLPILQNQFIDSWDGGRPYGRNNKVIDDAILKHPKYQAFISQGLNATDILSHFTIKSDRKIWTWKGYVIRSMTMIDSIKHELNLLHAAMLVMDTYTGEIKSIIGGNDQDRYPLNNAEEPRQVGSTFKPIVYLTALESGISPCTYYDNELRNYVDYDGWTPKNSNDEYGGSMSLYHALAHSVNTISVQVLLDAGISKVVEMAHKLGIRSEIPEVPSIVLGTADISLLEMMAVYGTLANKGIATTAHIIDRIEDKDGSVLYQYAAEEADTLIKEKHAHAIVEMLKNVSKEGTGRRINNYKIPFQIAGKTGTTQKQSDGWYIAASPQLVAGAWVGTMDRRMHFRYLSQGSGSHTALPIVGRFYESVADDISAFGDIGWQKPSDSIVALFDCPPTSEYSADRMNEWMKEREDKTDFESFLDKLLGRNHPSRYRYNKRKKSIFNIFKDREANRREKDRAWKEKRKRKKRQRQLNEI